MKQITNGKHINKGYFYRGYEVRNHGYYSPDRCNWWEAVNVHTGEADHHAKTKYHLKELIDEYGDAVGFIAS
jgi:hypothetical protein